MIRKLITIIFLAFFSLQLNATHIIGGYISYVHQGNNNYLVTMKIYRDCWGGQAQFDDPAIIGIFTGSGTFVDTVSVPNPVITNIPPVINNPCLTIPQNICVEEGVYVTTLNLPPRTDGYIIVYQRCCRNNSILNVTNPGSQGASYFAVIPGTLIAPINNSPVFKEFPPIAICNNEPLVVDQSATDADGDSLSYELCTSFQGASQTNPRPLVPQPPPYASVTYAFPYTFANPVASSPQVVIDPVTGIVTGTPNLIGQFVVGICVKEYRNGVLIGTYPRDFQFNVLYCPELALIGPLPDTSKLCKPFILNFVNNSTNANSYFWNFGDPTTIHDTSSLFEPTWTYPDTGVYMITLYATNVDGCKDTSYATVVIREAVKAKFIYSDVCPGEPVSFSDNSTSEAGNIISWKWHFGDGDSSSLQNPIHTYPGKGPYQVTLQIVTSQGCKEKRVLTMNFQPVPNAKFNYPYPCLDLPTGFLDNSSISSGNVVSWNWDFGDGGAASQAQNPTHTYTVPGTYTVTLIATSDHGCPDTTEKVVIIMPKPIAIADGDTSICSNEPVQLTASGGIFYQWLPITGLSNPNIANPVATLISSQTYIVTVSDSCHSDTTSVYVEILPAPVVDFTFSPDCVGDTTIFTDLSTDVLGSIVKWTWDFGDLGSSNLQHPVHVYQSNGPFNVTLTIENDTGCVASITKLVKPHPAPETAFSQDTTACLNIPLLFSDLSISDSGIINSWYWDFGDGSNNVTTQNANHTYISPGNYMVTLIVINSLGCIDSLKKPVTINPLPVAIIDPDTAICPGESIQLNASGGIFYDWQPNTGLTDPTLPNPVATPLVTTHYTVYVSDSCNTDTTHITITVNPAPVADFSFTAECVNDTIVFVDLSSTSSGTLTNWVWDFGDFTGSFDQNPIHVYQANGSYNASLTVTNSYNCETTVVKQVNPFPVADSDFSFDSIPCLGDPTQFTDKSILVSGIISNWQWDFGDATGGSSLQNPSHIYGLPGNYTVRLITTTNFGCKDTIEKQLNISAFVQAIVSPDTAICSLDVATLTASGGLYYHWEPSVLVIPDDGSTVKVSPPATTIFTVTVSDNCSADQATITVTVYEWPNVTANQDTTIYYGETAELNATGGPNIVSYLWEPDSNMVFPSTATDKEITVRPDLITWYVVTVTDANGCRNRDSALVDFLDPFIELPNAFTPNNDNLNDIFYVITRGKVELITFRIYNRWGQKIFETSGLADNNNGWDGTFKGEEQHSGSYTYIVNARAVLVGGPFIQKSGSFLLIR